MCLPYIRHMKTTLILRDELVRKAKSRAALRGMTLSRYMETCLENSLLETEAASVGDWLQSLPEVPEGATEEVDAILRLGDFDRIDPEMWS